MLHHRVLAGLLLLGVAGCDPEPSFSEEETSGDEAPRRHGDLPELRRVGDIPRGDWLFDGDAIGLPGEALHAAHLVRIEPDTFVVMVDGGPHREVSRREAWPMACTREVVTHTEGAMTVRLEPGAPVFVLAASRDAARISVGLHSEHSIVVWRDTLETSQCVAPSPEEADAAVATVGEGNVPCAFADQESLDETAGLPVPGGAPVMMLGRAGAWANVRISLRGGWVEGWLANELVADGAEGEPDWSGAALGHDRCVFPGRPEARPWEPSDDSVSVDTPPPTIPAIEIERVMRNGEPQIRACYEARRSDVPDLRVRLSFLLLVDADGRVSDADVTQGGNADAGLTQCVLERVRRWRFPPPRSGTVTVRHTFELQPPAATPEAPAEDAP